MPNETPQRQVFEINCDGWKFTPALLTALLRDYFRVIQGGEINITVTEVKVQKEANDDKRT